MKKNYPSILSLILIASISLFGCKKTQEDYTSTAESAESFAQDQPLIMSHFDIIDNFLSNQNFMQKNGNLIVPSGATIDYYDTLFDDGDGIEIEINIGTETYCEDEYNRYGSFFIQVDKPYTEIGSTTEVMIATSYRVSTSNIKLYFSSTQINSAYHFTVIKTEENKYSFEYNFELGSMTKEGWMLYKPVSGKFTITKYKGFETPEFTDDEIGIKGDAIGYSFNSNKKYTVNIEDELYQNPCAKIFTKGKLILKNEDSEVELEINFGDGACDNKLEVKSGAFKKEITL